MSFDGGLGQHLGQLNLALDRGDPLNPCQRRGKQLQHGGGLQWMLDVACVAWSYYSYVFVPIGMDLVVKLLNDREARLISWHICAPQVAKLLTA